MENPPFRVRKPRCFLVYAQAPEGISAAEANRIFNEFIADRDLPLVIYHDHFIGHPGGLAIFYAETGPHREKLIGQKHLEGWRVEYRPLIFSYNPAALDEQIAFTLREYRGKAWDALRKDQRPAYGDPAIEALTGQEENG